MGYGRVHRAYAKGLFRRGKDGFFDAQEAGRLILEQEAAAPGGAVKVGSEWDDRLKRARALREELELAQLKNELIPREDHIREVVDRELDLKDRFLGLPYQVAPLLEDRKAREIAEILHGKIVDIFKAVAKPQGGGNGKVGKS